MLIQLMVLFEKKETFLEHLKTWPESNCIRWVGSVFCVSMTIVKEQNQSKLLKWYNFVLQQVVSLYSRLNIVVLGY